MHEGPVVVFSGGGTGGHLYPALAIADALRVRRPEVRAVFLGARRGVEARVLPERGEEHVLLPLHGIDRSRPFRSWRALTGLLVSLVRVARLFRELGPEAVVVTGGYAAAPAGITAGLMGIPLVLQEQNSVPGLVTRVLTRWARRVHVAFPEAVDRLPLGRDRAVLTGNPVRSRAPMSRGAARRRFELPGEATVMLVVGGSQGSVALNRLVAEAVAGVVAGALSRPRGLEILWATGPSHFEGVRGMLSAAGDPSWIHVVPYVDDMPAALAATDLAVSRAGAMFTAELLNQGLPAVLVPLPTAAADHQAYNAHALERAGAAVVAEEAGLTGAGLWQQIVALVETPGRIEGMGAAAAARARPYAAREIAADIAELISGARTRE